MSFKNTDKIADIIERDFKQVLLLEHLGVPFIVKEKTVEDICRENNINPTLYLHFATLFANKSVKTVPDFNLDDIKCVVKYLQNCHNYYLNERANKIIKYVTQISQETNCAGIKLLEDFVQNYIDEIKKHFAYENDIVFPYMISLASGEKETNLGGQIDVYAEYSPIEEVTLSLGEEISFANFLAPENGLFDACKTVFAATYTPHPNIALEAGYEFLYSNAEVMEHCAKLSAIPQVEFGDFALSLQETAQMTYATADKSYSWQLVSKLELAYTIPVAPLSAYIYAEMTNPLQRPVAEPVAVTEPVDVLMTDVLMTEGNSGNNVPAKEQNAPWYDEICYRAGLDWSIDEINTLGIYYEFSHTVDSYSHLIGIGYTASF